VRRLLLWSFAWWLAGPGPGPGAGPISFQELGDRNASELAGDQGEVSIAADREAPSRLAVAAMNVQDGRLLTMALLDGGETWLRTLLPLADGAQLHADPMLAFDSRGVVHLAYIPVAAGNRSLGIDVVRSMDGVATWSPPLRVSKATGRDDKVALVVDDSPRSALHDRVYVAWTWPSGGIFMVHSSDGGRSFTRPRLVDLATVSGLDLAVSAEGIVYLAVNDGRHHAILVLRSTDGGRTFTSSVTVAPGRATWYTRQPSQCNRLSLVQASIATDRSDGPRRGWIYVTWSDYDEGGSELCADACKPDSSCRTRVYCSRSTDEGRSWSSPLPIPEQQPRSDRYFQWARTDRDDGALYVVYEDTRRDPLRYATDVYVSRSGDGGLSWGDPIRVSSASSDALGSTFQRGDYQGLAVAQGHVYPAWSDYRALPDAAERNGEVYVGRLVFDASQ
jgi:hypothetical protein